MFRCKFGCHRVDGLRQRLHALVVSRQLVLGRLFMNARLSGAKTRRFRDMALEVFARLRQRGSLGCLTIPRRKKPSCLEFAVLMVLDSGRRVPDSESESRTSGQPTRRGPCMGRRPAGSLAAGTVRRGWQARARGSAVGRHRAQHARPGGSHGDFCCAARRRGPRASKGKLRVGPGLAGASQTRIRGVWERRGAGGGCGSTMPT